MNTRIVRLLTDVSLEGSCATSWTMVDTSDIQPLTALGEASDSSSTMHTHGWNYHCTKHNRYFFLDRSCPGGGRSYRKGSEISITSDLAESLVRRGQAVYPTHAPVVDEGVQGTLDRTNALMDDMGLPHLDSEALRTFSVKGKKGNRHYVKPKDSRLARDLGIDPKEVAEMRKLAKGDSVP